MNLKELRMTQPGMKWVSVPETFSPSPCKGLPWTKSCLTRRWVSSQTCGSLSYLLLFSHLSLHPSPYLWALSSAATKAILFPENHRIYWWFRGVGGHGRWSHFAPQPKQLRNPFFKSMPSEVFTQDCWVISNVISALLRNAGAFLILIYFLFLGASSLIPKQFIWRNSSSLLQKQRHSQGWP